MNAQSKHSAFTIGVGAATPSPQEDPNFLVSSQVTLVLLTWLNHGITQWYVNPLYLAFACSIFQNKMTHFVCKNYSYFVDERCINFAMTQLLTNNLSQGSLKKCTLYVSQSKHIWLFISNQINYVMHIHSCVANFANFWTKHFCELIWLWNLIMLLVIKKTRLKLDPRNRVICHYSFDISRNSW